MVIVLYGTIGEYIKVFPLIEELGPDNCLSINVNMQPEQMSNLFQSSQLPKPSMSLLNGYKGQDIDTLPKMLVWTIQLFFQLWKLRKTVHRLAKQSATIFIIHGDTIIAPIGTLFGRFIYRLPVGHIEAGFRSGNWREPFPEELDRIITDRLATVNYANGAENIRYIEPPKTKGRIVDIKHNTIMDSLLIASSAPPGQFKLSFALPKKYMLVSMHRSEIISKKAVMTELIEELVQAAKDNISVVWLDHAPTQEKLTQYGLDAALATPNIIRIPKQPYFSFIRITAKADCIITDSGGLQEEAYLLGIPCLVHRSVNEKAHMGVLSHLNRKKVAEFLSDYPSLRTKPQKLDVSPTKFIIDDLVKQGFLQNN